MTAILVTTALAAVAVAYVVYPLLRAGADERARPVDSAGVCPGCGSRLEPEAAFCSSCGRRLPR